MRRFGRYLARFLGIVVLLGAGMLLFGPYEKIDLDASFAPDKFGDGVQAYFESVESQFPDITPGTEKRVIWQPGFKERRTPFSVLYLHGFSATSEEIRPVPDRIADALGANLVYTRLQGHGLGGAALGAASPTVWMQDVAEGLAAARAVGDRVVVISTSTGGTLAAAAALNPQMIDKVAAMVLVSPNFATQNKMTFLTTLPGARYWIPLVMRGDYVTRTDNELRKKFWTTSYPWLAMIPVSVLVTRVAQMDFSGARVPALFRFSDDDKVVRPEITRKVAGQWGGPVTIQTVTVGPGDDPNSHVIAGYIRSPGQSEPAVADILKWLAEQGIE